jgi:hypothetical protein
MSWGLSQALAGLGPGEYTIAVGINCGDRGGSSASQQLRAADGDVAGSCTSSTGQQLDSHSGVIAPWGQLTGQFTPAGDTMTILLWSANNSSDSWGGNCGIDFDGVTVEKVSCIQEWSLY